MYASAPKIYSEATTILWHWGKNHADGRCGEV